MGNQFVRLSRKKSVLGGEVVDGGGNRWGEEGSSDWLFHPWDHPVSFLMNHVQTESFSA